MFVLVPSSTHVEWVRAFHGAILELQTYVKEFHTSGLSWNPDVRNGMGSQMCWSIGFSLLPPLPLRLLSLQGPVLSGSGAPPPPPGGPGAPPPPPPPAVVPFDAPAPSSDDSKEAARSALMSELNKGANVTKGN